jgi:hypothetical protein
MGHLDDPTASTTDINFGMPRRVNLSAGTAYTNSNLYNVYWSKYIGEITNKNSKIVRGAFYLNPVDMEQLSFRDLYYFDNNYFRLNKVEDYDPVNPSVNICEFLLLNQGASFAASGGTIGSGGSTEQEYDPIGGGTNGKVIQNKGVSVGYYNRIGDGIGVGDAISNDGRANTAIGTNGTSFLPNSERSVVIGKGVQNVASDEVYLQGIKVLANDVDGTILDTTGAADGDALVYDLATKTWKPTAGTPGSYDDEQAQDAIGTILVDGATIDFTYNDATPSITAEVKNSSIGESKLLLADVTTHNVSTSAHGFVPKAPNTTTDFLRGDGTWAAPTDPTGYTTIVKSANQDVTNAGVTNDNDFSFAVVTGGHYMVQLDLTISGNNTTGDYTADFQVSAGTMKGKGTCQNLTAAAAVQNIIITAAAAANTTAIVTGAPTADLDDLVAVRMTYSFTASADATFRYRFGNASLASGRTSRTWKGSIMQHKRID